MRSTVLSVLMLVLLGGTHAILDITCSPNGTITIVNPNSTYYLYGMANDFNNSCNLTFNSDNTIIYINECSKDENIFLQLTNKSSVVFGGSNLFLARFQCEEISPSGVSRSIVQQMGMTLPTTVHASVQPTFVLQSAFRNGSATGSAVTSAFLADDLVWTIDVPETYSSNILECTAYAGNTSSGSTSTTLIVDGCTQQTELCLSFSLSKTITLNNNRRFYTSFYVFRFVASDTLSVHCTVRVCPPSGSDNCPPQVCNNTRRRRSSMDEIGVAEVEGQLGSTLSVLHILQDPYIYSRGTRCMAYAVTLILGLYMLAKIL